MALPHDILRGHRQNHRVARTIVCGVSRVLTAALLIQASPTVAGTSCAARAFHAAATRLTRVACYADAARRNRSVSASCLAHHDDRFERRWPRIGCAGADEAKTVASLADELATSTAAKLTAGLDDQAWGARCAAVKVEATGHAAVASLACAAGNPGPSAILRCGARASRRIAHRFRAAEIGIGCLTIGDAGAIGAAVGRFLEESTAAALPPVAFAEVTPIFGQRCASAGCHSGTSPSAGLDLSATVAWKNLVGVPSVQCSSIPRVDPTDPTHSYLITKLALSVDPAECHDAEQMPPAPALPEDWRLTILGWILHGAPPN